MLDFIWNTGAFIIALSTLVAIHEYGHFWVARRCNVKVHRFSIGFGKVLLKKKDKLGTEFVIAAIPLGGYVKMLDSRVEDVPPHLLSYAFDKKNVWQRIAIVAAGPIANFLLAIVAFCFMFMMGINSAKPVVSGLVDGSPASVISEENSFVVTQVNGQPVHDWEALNMAFVGLIGEPELTLEITPIKSTQPLLITGQPQTYHMSLSDWHLDPKKESPITSLGFIPYSPDVHLIADVVADNSASARSGLVKGDKLLAVNGVKLKNWQQFVELIQINANQPLQLLIERGTIETELVLTPDVKENSAGLRQGYIGLSPLVDDYPSSFRLTLQYGVVESLYKAGIKTWQLSELTFSTLIKLVTGDLSVKNLSGPIGIAKGAGMSADYGVAYFLGFIALISVNLGIMNLLPIPVLDGGHLLYYFTEALTGKAVPEKIQEFGFKVGVAVMMSFMSIALLNDFNLL